MFERGLEQEEKTLAAERGRSPSDAASVFGGPAKPCPSQKTRFGERREANVRRRGEQEGPGTNAVTAESAFGTAVLARRRALLASIKD